MEDVSGIPWVFIHLGWIVLAAVLAYGIWQNRRRRLSQGEKKAQKRKTFENFRVDEDSA